MRRRHDEDSEWRCAGCGRLLGLILRSGRLHLRFAHGEYVVGIPASNACEKCHTLNEVGGERMTQP
jgi:phage FluMu protein Com